MAIRPAKSSRSESGRLLNDFYKPLNTEISTDFNQTPISKYKPVWQRALFRIKFRKAFSILNDDILIYGTTNDAFDPSKYEEVVEARDHKRRISMLKQEIPRYVIRPDHPFKQIWNGLMILLLIYTATIMPYRIAFEDQIFFDSFTTFEIFMDFTFLTDCFINFISAYNKSNGDIEVRLKKIAIPYLKSWFIFDLLGSFPFSLIQYAVYGNNNNSLRANNFARAARLPRIYKIMNVFRFTKVSRLYKGDSFFARLKEYITVNGRVFRLLKLLISILICIHFIACFWYFAARLGDFPYDCWIVQGGFMDKEIGSKYLISFYWAFTTVSTVGYGDIHAYNETEMIMAVFCMMIGVGFYSMVVSSITSLMSSIDDAQLELSSKLIAATTFGKETGLNKATLYKVRQVIKYNATQGSIDNNIVFEELPKNLKYEISMSMHNGLAASMALFFGKDQGFIISVMTLLRPIKINSGDVLYSEGSLPDEFYVIMKGRINLVLLEHNFSYKSFLKGSYIGEYEIIHSKPRTTSMKSEGDTELLVMTKAQFLQLMHDFPSEAVQIRKLAEERYDRCIKAKTDAEVLLASKSKKYAEKMPLPIAEENSQKP